jgi:hypothetical protein
MQSAEPEVTLYKKFLLIRHFCLLAGMQCINVQTQTVRRVVIIVMTVNITVFWDVMLKCGSSLQTFWRDLLHLFSGLPDYEPPEDSNLYKQAALCQYTLFNLSNG